MKKFFVSAAAALALTMGAGNHATAQVEEGSMMIDLYYGFPNVGKSVWQFLDGEGSEGKATGIGPLGGRFEYMIADNLGVGVDINYVGNGYEYTDTITTYDSGTSSWVTNEYTYAYKRDKLRIMARINYHFVSTDAVDAYVGFGAGYKHKINSFTTTDPNGTDLDQNLTLIPVSLRVCLGTRFFFTENIGINLELGVGGGPIMSGGLSLKF